MHKPLMMGLTCRLDLWSVGVMLFNIVVALCSPCLTLFGHLSEVLKSAMLVDFAFVYVCLRLCLDFSADTLVP